MPDGLSEAKPIRHLIGGAQAMGFARAQPILRATGWFADVSLDAVEYFPAGESVRSLTVARGPHEARRISGAIEGAAPDFAALHLGYLLRIKLQPHELHV